MVHKIKNEINKDVELNEAFVELIKRNIANRRQSVIFLTNNKITLNSRDISVDYRVDDTLYVYRDGVLKDIIDVNHIVAIITK